MSGPLRRAPGLVPVLAGAVVGIVASWAAARLIKRFLFGVPPQDPVAFGSSVALLVVAAGLAAYLAARQASRVDPIEALRAE